MKQEKPGRKWFTLIIKIGVPVILLFFIGRYLYADRELLADALKEVKPLWLVTAFGFYFTGVACVAVNWKTVLNLLGARCSWYVAFRSYYFSQIAKYVPGRIWGATGRIVLTRGESIPEGTVVIGILIETLLLMISSSMVGFFALGSLGKLPLEVKCLALGTPFVLLLLQPAIFNNVFKFLARKFPKYVISPDSLPDFRRMFRVTLQYCLIWIFQGIGFWCVIHSIAPQKLTTVLPVIGCNALAWLAGFVVVFTPAGLGVRELVLTRVNSEILGSGPAALSAFVARILIVLSECLVSLILLVYGWVVQLDRKRVQC